MRPAPFSYHKAERLDQALALLAEFGEDARPIAGGQSLVPMMNLRLARPSHLVDINALDLDTIELRSDHLHIGALVRHERYARESLIAQHFPAFAEGVEWIGHPTIRRRGTLGGSISHADPTAELPALCVLLGAEIIAQSAEGSRRIPAAEFFISAYVTSLEAGEMVTGIDLPLPKGKSSGAFEEFAERSGDFAIISAGVTLEHDGRAITDARVVWSGVDLAPVMAERAGDLLRGKPLSAPEAEAAAQAMSAGITPLDDPMASAEFRHSLIVELTQRALTRACEKAMQAS
ncbi:FAD binding domain-containing protein [Pararhodobacter oceanensis]|uniref:Molybdopterin dehydrogenase n=1 Tax=Pararhodobacter oceanensis TaxID=2172121 RepID=A0A2T8HSR3_9RHOB|nr:xanthine dehydrogenase family protein subunit M [Pararhodobacter oceanensis]PVH28465.1 molybdopterin dehydrogenase [Pararhodobacter oceanensis]